MTKTEYLKRRRDMELRHWKETTPYFGGFEPVGDGACDAFDAERNNLIERQNEELSAREFAFTYPKEANRE